MSRTDLAVPLDDIRSCFEGVIPSSICTCSSDGTPNVTYLSIVHRLDDAHVALSAQFFNKTKENILANPRAQVVVIEPETCRQFWLDLSYERTETEGPVFEHVRTQLDAIASQAGMTEVFRLSGIDVYRALRCEAVPCDLDLACQVPEWC